ncbi:MAG: T9SS type A sorting domain-containing protein [Candidatus Marinimicrobia bacterium]|nr:T9SS type A sorting domain-containing protein [Candidatus Neomarinimicrobiota bacterium]
MRCSEDADVVLYLDEFTERKVLSAVEVTLNVIMKQRVEETSLFNLATDFVDVAGTMNSWGGTVMADFDGDTTYSVVLPLMPYSEHAFKFRINGSWSDATCEFPSGGPNRELTVGTSNSSHTYWYNDDTLEVAIDGIPVEFALHQNYPNPFNPTTTINFDLPAAADVKLVIYDIAGRKVRTLVNGNNIEAGYKKIVWNGRDDFGNGVATGMYIYRIIAGDNVDVKKMTFLK